MPSTSTYTSSVRTTTRPKASYEFTTTLPRTGRPLPAGPGPLDTTGRPLKSKPSISTGPIRGDHKVTYETTTRLDSWTPSYTERKDSRDSDSFANIYGTSSRRRSSVENTSYKPGSYVSRYPSHDSSSTSISRRPSITDRISQFESSVRNTDSKSGTSLITDRTSSLTLTSKEDLGLTGLRNIRNTCFMNCILQCLSNTKVLLEYCLNDEFLYDINDKNSHMKGQLMRAYAGLMKELWRKNGDSSVTPTAFKSSIAKFAPRFVGYSQQDSQEFLRYLLEGLHEDLNKVTSRPKLPPITEDEDAKLLNKPEFYWERYLKFERSIIVDIFVGQLRSTLKCTDCRYESTTFDPFWDLSLPIPKYSSSLHISDCLKLFTNEEVLDGDEKPTCARCKARRKCTKRFSIQRFPKVLVLHLKRFSGERFRSKLTTNVTFPLSDLDLSPFAADGTSPGRYNLTGVSNHSGTVFSGHYTAYCKHPYRGDWHEYNDQSVRPVTTRSVVSAEAYVLFYELADKMSRL